MGKKSEPLTEQTLADAFAYLDALRESGRTNMFSARPYVVRHFRWTDDKAGTALKLWMRHFSHEKSPEQRAATAFLAMVPAP